VATSACGKGKTIRPPLKDGSWTMFRERLHMCPSRMSRQTSRPVQPSGLISRVFCSKHGVPTNSSGSCMSHYSSCLGASRPTPVRIPPVRICVRGPTKRGKDSDAFFVTCAPSTMTPREQPPWSSHRSRWAGSRYTFGARPLSNPHPSEELVAALPCGFPRTRYPASPHALLDSAPVACRCMLCHLYRWPTSRGSGR